MARVRGVRRRRRVVVRRSIVDWVVSVFGVFGWDGIVFFFFLLLWNG